ncbi:Uncharacterised protein [Mycobacteroides abscessus subsp. abscessus]|nr:Uncharacterised protein [Mycobacteroides abscessus subsp. abscessus]
MVRAGDQSQRVIHQQHQLAVGQVLPVLQDAGHVQDPRPQHVGLPDLSNSPRVGQGPGQLVAGGRAELQEVHQVQAEQLLPQGHPRPGAHRLEVLDHHPVGPRRGGAPALVVEGGVALHPVRALEDQGLPGAVGLELILGEVHRAHRVLHDPARAHGLPGPEPGDRLAQRQPELHQLLALGLVDAALPGPGALGDAGQQPRTRGEVQLVGDHAGGQPEAEATVDLAFGDGQRGHPAALGPGPGQLRLHHPAQDPPTPVGRGHTHPGDHPRGHRPGADLHGVGEAEDRGHRVRSLRAGQPGQGGVLIREAADHRPHLLLVLGVPALQLRVPRVLVEAQGDAPGRGAVQGGGLAVLVEEAGQLEGRERHGVSWVSGARCLGSAGSGGLSGRRRSRTARGPPAPPGAPAARRPRTSPPAG